MSIALESGAGIGGSGFARGIGCVAIFDSAEIKERKRMVPSPSPLGEAAESSSSSSFSSIGENSDEVGSEEEEDGGEGEVQSAYKGAMLGMESLEESLPIRRGISNFYTGKSKSFTSLSDAVASSDSAKDLAKEENAYTRKQRNLLALNTMLERPHSNMLKSSGGGITKKLNAPARSTLAIAAAMSGSPRHINGGEDVHDQQQTFLPPLPRPGKPAAYISPSHQQFSFPMRSFSLCDLSEMASFGSTIEPGNVEKRFE